MLCHSPERLQGFASWSTAASQPQPFLLGLFRASLGVTQATSGVRQGPGRAGLRLCGAAWVLLGPWVCRTLSPVPLHPALPQSSPHGPGAKGDAAGGGSLSLGLPAVTAGARSCPQQEQSCLRGHASPPALQGGEAGLGHRRSLVPGARAMPARAPLLSPLGTSRASGRGAVRWQCHRARRGQAGRARLCCSSSQPRQPPAAPTGRHQRMDPGSGKQTAHFSPY